MRRKTAFCAKMSDNYVIFDPRLCLFEVILVIFGQNFDFFARANAM